MNSSPKTVKKSIEEEDDSVGHESTSEAKAKP